MSIKKRPAKGHKGQPSLIASQAAREVRNSDDFKAAMTLASDAAIGVILVRTREPYRAQEMLQEWAIDQEMEYRVWTVLTGWQTFPAPSDGSEEEIDLTRPINKDTTTYDPVKAFDKLEDLPENGCYVFMNPQHTFEVPGIQQHIKVHVRRALDLRQRVVILVPEGAEIPTNIEDDIHIVDFKVPSHAELREAWDEMLDSIEDDCNPNFSDEEVDVIIQNSLGMSYHEFDTALAIAFVKLRDQEGKTTPDHFIRIIMQSKVEVIKKTDILELQEEAEMTDVGGLDIYKDWVGKRSIAFTDDARAFGIDLPKGVLIVGPPGGGKSLVAKATARTLKVPCVNFDIGKVFGQFVGQSEQRMRKALNLVESMAPCVLLCDEVDKALGGLGGSSDSGTTSRVFGTFLTWMQERQANESPIFVVMTANNIVGMPPELMRRGRLDEIFAVTFPSEQERMDILKIHLAKRGHADDLTDDDLKKVAKATHDFVGAELEAIVKDSLVEAFYEGHKTVPADILVKQADQIIPISKAFADKVKFMNDWAKNNAKPASSGMVFADDDEETSEVKKRTVSRGTRKRRTGNLKPRSSEN